MNIAKFSIKRPVFITFIVLIIVIIGAISYRNIGLELFPNTTFPTIGVITTYRGASPEEIEKLISKPLEDEFGSLAELKHITSENTEGLSSITLEFNMDVDVDKSSQDIRDKINIARNNLPDDLDNEPVISKFDPDSSAIIRLALLSDLSPAEMYDLAKEKIKPQIERIKDVGNVQIIGGSRREIQIEIDQEKLNEHRISMTRIVNQIKSSGSNIPIGKKEQDASQTIFRSMGEYRNLNQISNTLISFSGDLGNSVSIKNFGTVRDGIKDIESIGYIYYPEKNNKTGIEKSKDNTTVQSCIYLDVIKQSGKNTVKVADDVKSQLGTINSYLKEIKSNTRLIVTVDQSTWIKTNVEEAITSIIIGIFLAVFVVFLFLGNIRSTIITAIAIPNSLLGAIIIMNVMGYTFNLMTLMALSLVVGLLVDDAIVVRENIFRKLEQGIKSHIAAEAGTTEVMLAVIATTLAILSVFFPIGMLSGVVGKLFKQFSFTVVFAMLVSLFDALTVAPFLSAYFAGEGKKTDFSVIRFFEKIQVKMDNLYIRVMRYSLNHPLLVIIITMAIFTSSIALLPFVKKTFFPTGNRGEFSINIEMPAGTSLQGTGDTIKKIEQKIKSIEDIEYYAAAVGNSNGDPTIGSINCFLKKERKNNTDYYKKNIRALLSDFSFAHPTVNDAGAGPGGAPFVLIVYGDDLPSLEKGAAIIIEKLKAVPELVDVDSTMKKGNPELRVNYDLNKMLDLGISNTVAGQELRYNITGAVVGKFREKGLEYDIRVRLKPDQRDLLKTFDRTLVPNANNIIVPISSVATKEIITGSAKINRMDKAYIVKISANLTENSGIGDAISHAKSLIGNNLQLPKGVSFSFSGESENYGDTASSVLFALVMAIVLIYMVLASLYESFITPFTILLAIPPALTGALFALFITDFMLDIFSMIGMVMLIGIVTKNSILLVDNAVHGVASGLDRKEAIFQAGLRRLRPILMTTFAMIAGTLPLALGIGEAAKMRQSMGVSIIGGIIVSTLVTLIVVPAVFEYIDRFKEATESKILVRVKETAIKKKKNPDKY